MDDSVVNDVDKVLSEIREIDDSFLKDGVSNHFLEFVKVDEESGLLINGNSEGLVHLARSILELVSRNVKGAHKHFDESGIVDQCDMTLTVSLKSADWD